MIKVTFLPINKTIEVKEGVLLFDAAAQAGLPVASSCSAQSVCGMCNMTVLEGGENLTTQQEWERKLLKRQHRPESDRISCITRVKGDCTVSTKYW